MIHKFTKTIITVFALALAVGCYAANEKYSVVFYHNGNSIDEFSFPTFKQARIFNKDCEIFLITNRKCAQILDSKNKDFLDTNKIQVVKIEDIKISPLHRKLLKYFVMDRNAFKGIWLHSTERLFYLESFMKTYHKEHVFHLENDVLIYQNLGEIQKALENHQVKIAMPYLRKEVAVGSIVYVDNGKSLSVLNSHIVHVHQKASRNGFSGYLNEMNTIGSFNQKDFNFKICNLPTLMPEYKSNFCLQEEGNENLDFLTQHFNKFQGVVFDGAGHGMYLGGVDGRIHKDPGPGYENSALYYKPSKLRYDWEEDANGRKVPFVYIGENKFKLVNLHIHSKHTQKFSSQ